MSLQAIVLLFLAVGLCQGYPQTFEKVQSDPSKLQSTIKDDGTYSFHAGSDPDHFYLSNADTSLQSDGIWHSTKDGSLKLSGVKSITGSDPTGAYSGKVFSYTAGMAKMEAQALVYNDGEFVRFTQSFPGGLMKCNVSDLESVLSAFPSFKIGMQDSIKDLGFLLSFGDMFGYSYEVADLANYQSLIRGGQRSGPLILFDTKGGVMIVSSYSNFMAHFMDYDPKTGVASFGVMGGAEQLPKNFQIDTILYYSNEGLNKAIWNWGRVITQRYHKRRAIMESDFTINYLGYWTDNGAYYYYHTEPSKTYEETILEVLADSKAKMIPYRYVQYDSWWYYKGVGGGVKNWTSMPSVFPNGMNNLFESHNLPVSAHNRYWASDTTYAKKNNGSYDFFVEETTAIPYDTKFWGDLMRSSKAWGLVTYEQDWLDREFMDLHVTHTNVSLGRDWLMEMGAAASQSDVTIQYCMALPRHMLQSVEIEAVTQARVSGDYHPGNHQWRIGVTSLFAHALNVAPYKDTFWTTQTQGGNPYGEDQTEPNTALQSAISTLSTGPVGPSDKIGLANIDLLMKCCRSDGLILKPSRPITSTNDNIMKRAFPKMQGMPNAEAEISTTYSDLALYTPSGKMMVRFGIALAADLSVSNYAIKQSDMLLDEVNPMGSSYVAHQIHPGTDKKLYNLTASDNLPLPTCQLTNFQLWQVAPVIAISSDTHVTILGERNKWVPVTSRRIRTLEVKGGNLLVDIVGNPDEIVEMDFLMNGVLKTATCKIPTAGEMRISANSMKCF